MQMWLQCCVEEPIDLYEHLFGTGRDKMECNTDLHRPYDSSHITEFIISRPSGNKGTLKTLQALHKETIKALLCILTGNIQSDKCSANN